MAESLKEVSSSMEALEGSEEGKKKSKFKAFRNFFGKKKKKEPEGAPEGKEQKPRFSSGSLKSVAEVPAAEPKPKSTMGAKAISHDSVFCLEPEASASKARSSPDSQRGRSQKRSLISRSLTKVAGTDALGASSASVSHYEPRSELWGPGFKISEIPPLRLRKLSISPSTIRSPKVSRDSSIAFSDDKTLKSCKKKISSHHSPPPRKVTISSTLRDWFKDGCPSKTSCLVLFSLAKPNSRDRPEWYLGVGELWYVSCRWSKCCAHNPPGDYFKVPTKEWNQSVSEMSSDLSQSSQSSTQQLLGFSAPATSQGCLDSSAAKYKITLSPRKLKRKKTISLSAKEKQEEYPLLGTKEKAKQADEKEQKTDNTGPTSQEQSYRTETQDKTREQAPSTDGASSTGYSTSGSQPRRRRRRAKSEWGIIERSLAQCTQDGDASSRADSSPNEELVSRDHAFLKLFLEKQGKEHTTTAEMQVTTPQEMSVDRRNVKGEMAAMKVEVQRTAARQPTPTNVAESMAGGLPLSREDDSSEGRQKRDRAVLFSRLNKSSTSQEEATASRTIEVQACVHHSQVRGEKEEVSSLGLQKFQPKMESIAYHRERHARSSLQAFSSAKAEDTVPMQRLPLPFRRWPTEREISSDTKSSSEYESSSEVQPGPTHSFQLAWNPQDDDDVFLKSENVGAELSKVERQPPLGYCSQSFGNPKAREVSLDLDSSEDQRSCEEMTSAHSSQSLGEFEECSESRSFIIDSISQEQLAPRRHSQALQGSEEKEVSTESSSYVEKYHSSEDLSSSTEEEQPPECSKQTRGQFRDQQEVPPVSKSAPKELSVSAKPLRLMHTSLPIVSPIIQQQTPISMNISVGQNRSVAPLPLSHTVKPWVSPQSEHQMFAGPEGIAADWDKYMQSPSPRKALMHPMGYNVEQNVPSSTDISTMGEVAPMEALVLRHHSQAPIRQVLEKNVSAGPELAVFKDRIASQPLRYSSQPLVRSNIKKEIPLGAESAAFEGSRFMEPPPPQHHSQPLLKPFIKHQASAFERGVSMDPRLRAHPFQPWTKFQGKRSFSTPESTAFEGNPSTEHGRPTLAQPVQQPYQNVPLESEAVGAKIISMGPLHTKYSAPSSPNPQSHPASESTSVEGATLVELLPPQPSVKPKFQPQMTRDPVSASTQWGSPMEPVSVQRIFQTQASPKFKQVPTGLDSPEAQGSISVQPGSPRCPSQSWLTPSFEQMSVSPGNVPSAWSTHSYPTAPRMPSQPLMGSVVQQPVSPGSMNPSVQQIITVEPMSSRHPLQPWPTSPFEQVTVPSDSAPVAAWSIPVDPPATRMLSQPLMGSVVKQPVSTELVSISAPQSSSMELIPSRFPFQPRVDPESYTAEEGVSVMMRPRRRHSQPPISTGSKEEISPDSVRTSGEWGIPIKPMPSKFATQPWLGPAFEQQTSNLEGFAKEEEVSKEAWLSRNPSQVLIKQQVPKTPSSFESTSAEGGVPWKSLPLKGPTPFLMRPKIQEMSSSLESVTTQDSSKKAQDSSSSSQSFVKFMAEQIFSGSSASEADIYTKPMLQSRSRPSRSLLKPKLEEQTFLYKWDDEPKEDPALKALPVKPPSQSLGRPEESQEILSYSEGAPPKWSGSAVDVSQPLGKLEYGQKLSVSVTFPKEWVRSEEQLPSTQPSQAFNAAGLQPPVLSTGSANVPVDWSYPEGQWAPGQPTQAFLITDYQQQVYLSSANAAAEGTISQNTGSWSCPDSPKKTTKYTQGYGDLIQSTPTSVTKPGKLTTGPAQKAFVCTGTYSKEEVPQGPDGNESPPIVSTSKADVENVFGVRLRRISQKSGTENLDPCTPVVPASKEWMDKGAPQGFSGSLGNFSPILSFAEKRGSRPRYEGPFKKPAVYRPPGKTSNWKADYTTEPAWINVAKQRQKGFVSHFLKKTKTRVENRGETKEPRYESNYESDLEVPVKEHEPIADSPSRMTFSSTVPRQEMSKLYKSTKTVAFDDQNLPHPYISERETRRSSSLPPKFSPPEEPVWFAMAKKKSQAWSQMSEIMK
ncbi:acrosomal protein KIAA1210 homolog [Peromyscus leucopus]|uniref:acrosomal protein KIAA1210 homolog n=1 Tax=Peromyscus leucopus TaxID=10041 RepID=UPI001884D90E|nr:acrosomal protein KIAA1210 homolog [Peromyscus leucopus]